MVTEMKLNQMLRVMRTLDRTLLTLPCPGCHPVPPLCPTQRGAQKLLQGTIRGGELIHFTFKKNAFHDCKRLIRSCGHFVVKFDFLKDKKFNVYVTGVWNCHLPVCGGGSTGADTVFWERVYAFMIC